MFLFLYRRISGYLYVKFVSNKPEKLLNICAANGINVWRVAIKNNCLYFKTGIASFKKIRLLKRKIKGKIHITKKCGLPFFVAKNKHRYGMVAGFVLFFAILYFLSGFIWNIDISGNETISDATITKALEEIGIYEGVRISKINTENHRNELLLKCNNISWAAINIEGSRLTLDITEAKFKDEKSEEPSNLKADSDGIIKSVEIISGTANVKVGDAVRKGDLLVSGIMEYQDMHTEFVRSRGKIIAEVERDFKIIQPMRVKESHRTGEKVTRSVLSIFGIKIPLYFGRVSAPYECDKETESNISDKPYLPIRLIRNTFYFVENKEYILSEEEAKRRATAELEKQLKEYLGEGEVIDKKITYSREKDNFAVLVEIKCQKDIIFEEKLLLNTRNQ